MLYAVIFAVVLVIIILVTLIRMAIITYRRRKALRAGSPTDPPARFTEVARDVSHRWFGAPMERHASSAGGHVVRGSGLAGYSRYGEGVHPSERTRTRTAEVVRDDPERGDPELPSYYDSSTLPLPPDPIYTSPLQSRRDPARHSSTSIIPPPVTDGSEPPKYDIAMRA